MIGQILGNYKILHALGEGGVGMVYKGVDTMLDREVAVKVLRPELASQTSVVERFRSEAVTLAKLSHPNIATLFSLFRHGQDLIMVMEFVRGESLETIIQRRGRVSPEEAIPIFCQALDGINHAHEVGIIHRDIKPSNMILTETGTLKVLDFGIARLLGSSRMTRVGNIIGTLEYMSPEQVRGEDTDARSDIYALGMMLYEILTGKLPFESENEFVLMKMQTEQMPAPPRQLNADIPPGLEAAIMRAVAKNPNERFQDAGEFLQTLLEVDLPLSSVEQFGLASLYQAKLRTRPSNPGLHQTDSSPKQLPQTAPTNQQSENLSGATLTESAQIVPIEQPTAIIERPTEILEKTLATENETKKLAPEIVENSTILSNQSGIETANNHKETRIAKVENSSPNSQQTIAKETRLGANENRDSNRAASKPTRFGATETAEFDYPDVQKTSFFEKLNWIHYAGTAAILLGVISLATFGMIILTGSDEKPTAAKSVVKEEPKPEIKPAKVAENTESQPVSVPQVTTSETTNFIVPPKSIETKPDAPKKSEDAPRETPKETSKDAPKETKSQTPSEAKRTAPPVVRETKQTKRFDSPSTKAPNQTRQNPPTPRAGPTPSLTDN
ncbi:MAG: protein kinase [Pyrinomonadaceae bacterium]|nr:protein kinase [Pyrinomonadaceae bacterium]